MNEKEWLVSVLGPTIAAYVALKQALGRRYDGERRILALLDHFLAGERADLTAETFTRWCHTQEHLTSGVRRHRMRVVRNLTLYLRRRGRPASSPTHGSSLRYTSRCSPIFSPTPRLPAWSNMPTLSKPRAIARFGRSYSASRSRFCTPLDSAAANSCA